MNNIQTNYNQALAQLLNQQMVESFGVEGASTQGVFAASEKGLTLSFTDGTGATSQIVFTVPELDPPEGDTVDTATLLNFLENLDLSDLEASDETLEKLDTLLAKLKEELTKLQEKYAAGSVGGTDAEESCSDIFADIYQLIALLAECARTQKVAAREARAAAYKAQVQAINSQAEKQEQAALTGLISSCVVGAVQFAFQAFATYKQVSALGETSSLAKEYSVDTRQRMLNNTSLQGNQVKAQENLGLTQRHLQLTDAEAAQIKANVTGEKVSFKTGEPIEPGSKTMKEGVANPKPGFTGLSESQQKANAVAVGEINKAENEINGAEQVAEEAKASGDSSRETDPEKIRESAKNSKTEAEKTIRGNYREAVDKNVARYESRLKQAEQRFNATKLDPQATKAEKQAAASELKTAQGQLEYANAVRTEYLSRTQSLDIGGDKAVEVKLYSNETISDDCKLAGEKLKSAGDQFKHDPVHNQLERKSLTWRLLGEAGGQLANAVTAATTSSAKLKEADATREGAKQENAKFDRDLANELIDNGREMQQKVCQLMSGIIQAEMQSHRSVMSV